MTVRDYVAKGAAFARVELGMRREEYLAHTPREWSEIEDAWRDHEHREDRRTARLCMVLAWCHGNPEATEADFIPTLVDEDEPDPSEILNQFKAATAGKEHARR